MRRLTIIYSPMCFACQLHSRWDIAREYGYEVEEVSILDIRAGKAQVNPVVETIIAGMAEQGGFLFGPLAIFEDENRVMPFFEVKKYLKGESA